MRNILIALCYRGTAYHGFQVQKNAPSVCAAIQDALERVLELLQQAGMKAEQIFDSDTGKEVTDTTGKFCIAARKA